MCKNSDSLPTVRNTAYRSNPKLIACNCCYSKPSVYGVGVWCSHLLLICRCKGHAVEIMHYIFSLYWPCCKRSLFPHCQRKYACSVAELCVKERERAQYASCIFGSLWLSFVFWRGVKTNWENGKNNLQSYTCLCPGDEAVPENIFIFICLHLSRDARGLMNLRWVIWAIGYISLLKPWNVFQSVSPAIVLSNLRGIKGLLCLKRRTRQWNIIKASGIK